MFKNKISNFFVLVCFTLLNFPLALVLKVALQVLESLHIQTENKHVRTKLMNSNEFPRINFHSTGMVFEKKARELSI